MNMVQINVHQSSFLEAFRRISLDARGFDCLADRWAFCTCVLVYQCKEDLEYEHRGAYLALSCVETSQLGVFH